MGGIRHWAASDTVRHISQTVTGTGRKLSTAMQPAPYIQAFGVRKHAPCAQNSGHWKIAISGQEETAQPKDYNEKADLNI